MMSGTLKRGNDDYLIEYSAPKMCDPVLVITRWKVTSFQGPLRELRYDYESGRGNWVAYADGVYTTIVTEENASSVEETPIFPPKTALETRWHNGRWERYLKRKGWTA